MKDPEEMEMMAYTAGLIDGDGNIGIRVGPRGKLCPLIQLHNSIRSMPRYLNKILGGTLVCDKPRKEGNRSIWKWMLQGEAGALNFINKVAPYLVIKKDSAEAVHEFISNPVIGKNYYQICKELNYNRKIECAAPMNIERRNSDNCMVWAYIAGLMDTDGSFSIERSVRKPTNTNRQVNDLIKYRPKIMISMVSERAIYFILSNCTVGNFYKINANTALRGSAFRFCISARKDAIEFLKKIIPYLQTKSVQAVKLLNFCRSYDPTNGLAKVPEEERKYREDCYKEIFMLNNTPS